MELGDKETVATYMHSSKCDMLSARNTSLYAYGTYHTRMVIPYAYGIQNCTVRVWYIPYAYGMFFFFFLFFFFYLIIFNINYL